jgi:hypothetical protein
VVDYKLFGKERNLFLRKWSGRAVTQVSRNRMAHVCELDAYLMPASGLELYSYKSAALREIQHRKRESRLLSPCGFPGHHQARPVFPPFDEMDEAAGFVL